jgi:hypothetical protein
MASTIDPESSRRSQRKRIEERARAKTKRRVFGKEIRK